MNVQDSADLTVHDYPGGSESLAPRLGMSAAVLRGKVNTNNDRNHLTLAEADRMMGITGDHRILVALAAEHGYALQRIDEGEQPGNVVAAILALDVAGGEFSRTIRDALADNIISEREMADIAEAAHACQSTLISLVNRLRGQQAKGPRAVAA